MAGVFSATRGSLKGRRLRKHWRPERDCAERLHELLIGGAGRIEGPTEKLPDQSGGEEVLPSVRGDHLCGLLGLEDAVLGSGPVDAADLNTDCGCNTQVAHPLGMLALSRDHDRLGDRAVIAHDLEDCLVCPPSPPTGMRE